MSDFDELVLAVARDAGDPEDLAGPDLEVDAADNLVAAVVEDVEPGDRERSARPDATRPGRR